MAVDWSMLPLDIVATIAIKLETLEDFIYLSAVCRCWNRVLSSIKHQWKANPSLPWLLLTENTKENPDCPCKILNLNDKRCYSLSLPVTFETRCWGSAYGWVAMVDRNLDVQLFNPITKAHLSFPNVGPLDTGKGELDVGRKYIKWVLRCFLFRLIVLKVFVNCHNEFVIIIIYGYDKFLAFARHGDQSWTTISIEETRGATVVDVVGIDDHVFALYDDGSVRYWEINDFNGLELIKPQYYSMGSVDILDRMKRRIHSIYMVPSGRDLLMVLRFKVEVADDFDFDSDDSENSDDDYDIYKTITSSFQVYKLEPKDKSWVKTEDLGEVALFVGGSNSSMCVSVVVYISRMISIIIARCQKSICMADMIWVFMTTKMINYGGFMKVMICAR